MNARIAPLAVALMCGLFAVSTTVARAAADDAAKKDEKKAEAAKPINKNCPVEGGKVDPEVTLVHEGKTIGFCCAGCDEEFKKNPAKFMAVLAKEEAKDDKKDAKDSKDKKKDEKKEAELNKKCPVTGDDADKSLTAEHKGRKVAFCCEDCVKDFKKDPEKYLKKLDEEAKAKDKKDGKKSDEKKDEKAK